MWLQVPETIENILWEGTLEPATDEAAKQLARAWVAHEIKGNLPQSIQDLPIVSIGQPEVWSLEQVFPPKKLPSALQSKLKEADFYFVRMACSFRSKRDNIQVEWARFLVHLLPDTAGRQPIAFDLHPLQVTQEVRRNVKVSLSPTLKFQEAEGSFGGVEFGFEYPELQPLINAEGAGEPNPNWDYQEARGVRVQGSKWMHLLVKVPKGTPSGRANLDLTADVQMKTEIMNFRLAAVAIRKRKEAETRLAVRLWG